MAGLKSLRRPPFMFAFAAWKRFSLSSSAAMAATSVEPKPSSTLPESAQLVSLPSGVHRMSRLFLPTLSGLPASENLDDDSRNYRLLLNNGFIFPSQSGMFHFLPLGLRVLKKLNRAIIEEMEFIGGQEVFLSSLMSSSLWRTSGRWDEAGKELFRLTDRRNHQQCLAPTFEESVTAMLANLRKVLSVKHLPVRLFQISTKYRDEVDAKKGLLRGREFVMKDMYSFDNTTSSAISTYDTVCSSYERLLRHRLGLDAIKVVGAVGKIGGVLSHEFQVPSPVGEDQIVLCRKCGEGVNAELDTDASWRCECSDPQIERILSIEVGHSFLLGTKYSSPFNATFRDNDGVDKPLVMGCYGIGVSRLLAAFVEVNQSRIPSSNVIIWPRGLAPFSLAIIPPKLGSKESTTEALDAVRRVSASLEPDEILVDDRLDYTIGKRLVDMRRIGVPKAVVVGQKMRHEGKLELVDLFEETSEFLTVDEVLEALAKKKDLEK